MLLRIAPNRLISDVQLEFNNMFPFLKLEFFRNKVFQDPESAANQVIPHYRKIRDGQAVATEGIIEIVENMKVRELEKLCKDIYKMNVQVFRRSGNLWLQTAMTNDWTLWNQNKHGMEISYSHHPSLTGETKNKVITPD